MKKLPSSGQTFSTIIQENLLYVDKTEYIHRLIKKGVCYFLSRPRRFGKSLLLGTMKELFLGNRDLFKGLWIDSSNYDFKKYPVIHLTMTGSCNTKEELRASIVDELKVAARKNGLTIEGGTPSGILKNLISSLKLKTGNKVVVLIDEYDAPILDQINNIPQAAENREELKSFYIALKTLSDSDDIRFIFITGVSKFSKASVFSGLNNLEDLTLLPEYNSICGFTLKEFDTHFTEYLPEILKYNIAEGFIEPEITPTDLKKMILDHYGGYSWDGENRVLNPFSLIKFLREKTLKSYWFSSSTPSFLINLLKKKQFKNIQTHSLTIIDDMLDAYDLDKLNLLSLLFQTGYLTIDNILSADSYLLKEPNIEVTNAFNAHIVKELTNQKDLAIS
jgi:hypothetical protein